tara:strand:+ start:15496 stop:16185 length:690 start_codon:yes stop_codon:yes gene_type:complete
MSKLYIHQPDFLPSLNFFLRSKVSDNFVILDDVQFNRRGWTNRDLIKTQNGSQKITIPVKYMPRNLSLIKNIKISYETNWVNEISDKIEKNYNKSKFYENNFNLIHKELDKKHEKLIDLNVCLIKKIFKIFNIRTKIFFSSNLNITSKKSDKILEICKKMNCREYITGSGSKTYLDLAKFKKNKIKINFDINFKKKYEQINGNFVENLSVIDYLFNCYNGSSSSNILND